MQINGTDTVDIVDATSVTATIDTLVYLCNTKLNDMTLKLPESPTVGSRWYVKKIAAEYTLTVGTVGSPTIDGETDVEWTADNDSFLFVFDGTNYNIL